MDSGCIFHTEPIGFPDGLNVGSEEEGGRFEGSESRATPEFLVRAPGRVGLLSPELDKAEAEQVLQDSGLQTKSGHAEAERSPDIEWTRQGGVWERWPETETECRSCLRARAI